MKILAMSILVVALVAPGLVAQTAEDSMLISVRAEFDSALAIWDGPKMIEARAKFERLLSIHPDEWLVRYYIAYSNDNLVQFYRSQGDEDKAEEMVDDAIEQLDLSTQQNQEFAESYALLSNAYGQKIGFSPLSAVYLGPRTGIALQKARELDPENPRVALIEGFSYYFRPSMFGGSKEKARELFKEAAEHYKNYTPASERDPDWGHATPYIWLGTLAMNSDSLDLAESYYEQALTIQPGNGFVSNTLIPALEAKRSGGEE